MINLMEVFNLVGVGDCQDVATSLVEQGCDPEISIPIYDILFLNLCGGHKTGKMADNIYEYNMIRKLAENIGAVACTLNILDLEPLTIASMLIAYTPNTGANIFFKWNEIDSSSISADVIHYAANKLGLGVAADIGLGVMELLQNILNKVTEMVLERLDAEVGNGINIREFNEIPAFYEELHQTGELMQMRNYRLQSGAHVI